MLASEKNGLAALTSQVALAAANLLKGFLATKASGSSVTAELIFFTVKLPAIFVTVKSKLLLNS